MVLTSRATALGVSGVMAIMTIGLATACGSNTSSTTAPTTPAAPSSAPPSTTSTTTAAATATGAASGITFLVCDSPTAISLHNVPGTGGTITQLASWQFQATLTTNGGPTFGCSDNGYAHSDGWLEREQFSSDFTKIAVVDKGIAATEAQNGSVTDVGPTGGTGYGGQAPNQESPLFQPGTDRLWYADGNQKDELFSVDASQPTNSPVDEHQAPSQYCDEANTCTPYFSFGPDGKLVDTGDPPGFASGAFFAPSDQYGVDGGPSTSVADGSTTLSVVSASEAMKSGNQIDPSTGNVAANVRTIPAPSGGDCVVQAWVSATQALCAGETPNVYLLTFNRAFTAVHSRPLLPNVGTDVEDDSVVVSPDDSSFAFVSVNGQGDVGLYSGSISGGQPTLLTDLSSVVSGIAGSKVRGHAVSLLQWR